MEENYRSCSSHCCKNHGCKYGHEGCPVANGTVTQEFPCEYCAYELEERGVYGSPAIGETVLLKLQRPDGTMADMPTPEEIERLVSTFLNGQTIRGWAITVVPS